MDPPGTAPISQKHIVSRRFGYLVLSWGGHWYLFPLFGLAEINVLCTLHLFLNSPWIAWTISSFSFFFSFLPFYRAQTVEPPPSDFLHFSSISLACNSGLLSHCRLTPNRPLSGSLSTLLDISRPIPRFDPLSRTLPASTPDALASQGDLSKYTVLRTHIICVIP